MILRLPVEDHHHEHLRGIGIEGELPSEIHAEQADYEHHYKAWQKSIPGASHQELHKRALANLAWRQHGVIGTQGVAPHVIQDAKLSEQRAIRSHLATQNYKHLPELIRIQSEGFSGVGNALTQLADAVDDHTKEAKADAENVSGSILELEKRITDVSLDFSDALTWVKRACYGLAALLVLLIAATLFAPKAHGQFSRINYMSWQQNGSPITNGFVTYPYNINCIGITCLMSSGTINITGPVYDVAGFAGANLGAKIIACFTALPSTGGVCDARGITGAQTISSNIFSGMTKPVVLMLGEVTISDSSCWTIPNDGASPPKQAAIHIIGVGIDAGANTAGKTPTSGTIIDNSCATGPAKIDSRGEGVFELEGVTLMDSGGGSNPFMQFTNTIPKIHDNGFFGSKNGTACDQDVILLGSTTTNIDGSSTAAFQGYGGYITHNFANHIRRLVYARTYVNGFPITQNTVWVQSGAGAGLAAIEFDGGSDSNTGNIVRDNLIEVTNYPYAVKFTANGFNNIIEGNGLYDPSGTHLGGVYFAATSKYNRVVPGWQNDSYAVKVETGASVGTNDVMTSHQNQFSEFTAPVKFTNQGAGSPVASVREEIGGVNLPLWNSRITTTNDEFFWGISTAGQPSFNLWIYPAGGSGQELAQFKRYSSTQAGLQLDGSAENFIESLSDLKLRASGGTGNVTWIGTTSALKNYVGDDGVWHNTVSTGTAPFAISSTTVVPNLHVATADALGTAGTTTTVLHGNAAGSPTYGAVVEADQTLADNTTNNASTSAHGYLKKLDNTATHYMDGTGAWSTPSGGSTYTAGNGIDVTGTVISDKPLCVQTTIAGGDTLTANGSFATTCTIAAGALAAGSVIEIWTSGTFATGAAGSGNVQYGVKFGSTIVATAVGPFVGNNVSWGWNEQARLIVTAAGASGSAEAQNIVLENNTATGSSAVPSIGQKTTTIDTTGTNAVTIYVVIPTSAGNTTTMRQLIVKVTK